MTFLKDRYKCSLDNTYYVVCKITKIVSVVDIKTEKGSVFISPCLYSAYMNTVHVGNNHMRYKYYVFYRTELVDIRSSISYIPNCLQLQKMCF